MQITWSVSLPHLDKECFILFYLRAEEQRHLSEKTLMIIVNGAGSPRLDGENQQIQLSQPPPYSSELKPAERVFQKLPRKLKICVSKALREAEDDVSEVLTRFLDDNKRLKPLTLYSYIK